MQTSEVLDVLLQYLLVWCYSQPAGEGSSKKAKTWWLQPALTAAVAAYVFLLC
jgi:hypothetical protein